MTSLSEVSPIRPWVKWLPMTTHGPGGHSTSLSIRPSISHILTITFIAQCNIMWMTWPLTIFQNCWRLTPLIKRITWLWPTPIIQPVILPLTLREVTSLFNLRTVTINEFNSQDYPQLYLTFETLSWDPTTNLYEQQENNMMGYSGNIVRDAAVRGQVPTLIVNDLQSLTTYLADMMHDCNFHQVLTSHVIVSSINASLSGHVWLRKAVPIDFMTSQDGEWLPQSMQRRLYN